MIKTKEMLCPKCHGPMDISKDERFFECPLCGYKELIEDSDSVSQERIRASAYKEVTLGQKKLDNEARIKEQLFELEKKKLEVKSSTAVFRWIIIVLAACIVVALLGVGAYRFAHRNQVQMKMLPEDYIGEKYSVVQAELEDTGFTNIRLNEKADLGKGQSSEFDNVSQVSINGNISFKKNTWFRKDAPVVITYHCLNPAKRDDIQVPEGSFDYIGRKYSGVQADLENAGFTKIQLQKLDDLSKAQSERIDKVSQISISGNTSFTRNTWFNRDAPIVITYHCLAPEKENEIQTPGGSSEYKDVNYTVVVAQFKSAGFEKIELQAIYDVTLFSKIEDGAVEEVLIDDDRAFSFGEWVPKDSRVKIYYHTKKASDSSDLINVDKDDIVLRISSKDLKGKNYDEVIDILKSEGFSNITTQALKDLKVGIFHKDGEVKSITIGGDSNFKSGAKYSSDEEVVITYHSPKNSSQ